MKHLNELRQKNINKLVISHLNINSLSNKFDQLKLIIKNEVDILVITETKLDSSFPDSQFKIDGFRQPYRLDRNKHGGGVMILVNEDIPSKLVSKHTLPDDMENMFIEIKLRKTKWLILGTYHPPNQPDDYLFKAVGNALDQYLKTYEKFLLLGDFNAEDTEPILSEFLEQYEAKNIMKNKTCFKNPDRPTCIDLFLTNSQHSFQNTMTISTGLSDFHKMIITVLKSSFIKLKARETYYRDYKNFSSNSFREELTLSLGRINKGFDSFEDIFMKTLNRHAPMKKKFVRPNEVPYMTKVLRKEIMKRSERESKYLKNKSYQNMKIYKKQKNFCSKLYKEGKKKKYSKTDTRKITDNKKHFGKQFPLFFLAKLLVYLELL